MFSKLKKWQKALLIFLSIIILLLAVLPSIARRMLEKNGEEWIGRKVQLEKLSINYFRFSVTARGFTMYEQNGQDSFLSFERAYLNLNPWPLFRNEISVSAFELVNPNVKIIQQIDSTFNFQDFMDESDSLVVEAIPDSTAKEEPLIDVKFSIDNIKIVSGHMAYDDQLMVHQMEMEEINLNIPHIAWNNEQSTVGLDFDFGKDGNVLINGTLSPANEEYAMKLTLSDIDLGFVSSYLKDYMAIDSLNGNLDSEIYLNGSLREVMDFELKGQVEVSELSITQADQAEFFTAYSAGIAFDQIHPGQSSYQFSSIWVDRPEISIDLVDSLTNLERVFAPLMEEADSTLAEEPQTDEVEEEEVITYSIDSLHIRDGQVIFSDQTLGRPFHYEITDIELETYGIKSRSNEVPLDLSLNLNNTGKFEGQAILDPSQPYNFKFKGAIKNMSLTSFSPYTEHYIASPITRGRLDYDVSVDMTPTSLKNENKITIDRVRFGERVENETAIKLPIKLAIYMIETPKGLVNFDFPVKGNPSDPSFRVGPIIWKTVTNTILKVTTSPINILGKLVTANPEKLKSIPFEYLQDSLQATQIELLNSLIEIHQKKPDLTFTYIQETDVVKEKGMIAIKELKRKYLIAQGLKDTELQSALNNLPDADEGFLSYIDSSDQVPELSLEERSIQVLGNDLVEQLFDNLIAERNQALETYFANQPGAQALRVRVETADLRNMAQEHKSPKFRIEVSRN